MEAVVVFTPKTNKATLNVGNKDNKISERKLLSNFTFAFKKKGSNKVEAIKNLIKEKLKGGILTKPILVTLETAPPIIDPTTMTRIALVLSVIVEFYNKLIRIRALL